MTTGMRRIVLLAAAAAGLWPLSARAEGQQATGSEPIHVRIVWTENPQTEALVAWSTRVEGKVHGIAYDTRPKRRKVSSYKYKLDAQKNGRFSGGGPELYYHHANLAKLQPSTTYYFVVVSDRSISREYCFTTAPDKDVPFKIFVGGDSRSRHGPRRQINQLMGAYSTRDKTILAFAHGGDYVEDGNKLDQWEKWLNDHELTIGQTGRVVPIIPARGNHEAGGNVYDEVFGWPGGGKGKNYFTTLLSPEVLMVTLNTEIDMGGQQKKFLEETLQKCAKVRWQTIQYHRPAYAAVKGPSDAMKEWVPIFEKYNLDVACEADGHCIKRTAPVRAGKVDPTGVIYVGEGGLGAPQRQPRKDEWFMQGGVGGADDHVMMFCFNKTAMEIHIILAQGRLMDRHAVKARER